MAQAKKKRFYSDDDKSVLAIKDRFLKVNKDRLNTVRNTLRHRQRQFLDIIPLLFHYNDLRLPGYVGEECPIGIYDYSPANESIDAAKSLVKNYGDKRSPLREYHIYALYVIGSAGTIAYTDKSDLDIWVCHRSDLSEEDVYALQQKCDKLTAWAASISLEANFFLLTPESIREGRIESMSEESSGSAQHLLLIEEFYRSGLLLAGRVPAWWLVPPDQENNYYQYLEKLLSKKIIAENDIVDFGDVNSISPAEFYGAALWQLNKAITSPYKSILKLLLMESYASEYPDTELLCTRLKRAIYDGETNIDKLDSYVLMISKLDEYFSNSESQERLQLARRCFYFKVNEWLTDNTQHVKSRTHEIMSELTSLWKWTRDDLLLLDTRNSWKIDRVQEERKILVKELTNSYRMLTDLARQHTMETNISQEDLNILGRRLYTTFERKAGKIELVNQGISADVSERRLAFVHLMVNGTPTWLLYRREYKPDSKARQVPIKRSQGILELVAWSYFNGLIGSETMVTLQNYLQGISSADLLKLIETFQSRFPGGKISKSSVKQLSGPATIVNSAIFVNLGIDPFLSHSRRGLQLTSNRSDPLSFGGKWQNLLQSCCSLVITSWGEILTSKYDDDDCVLDCLTEYLSWTPLSREAQPSAASIYSYSASQGGSISRRIAKLQDDLILYFYKNKWKHTARYIMRIEKRHVLLQMENGVPRYQHIQNERELIKILGEPQQQFSPYMFDRYSNDIGILNILPRYNQPNVIQLFYYDKNDSADIFVLDEHGSLYYQEIEYFDIPTMLGHYRHFFDAAIKRRNMQVSAELSTGKTYTYEFYTINKSSKSGFYVEIKQRPRISSRHNYFDIQVIGDIFNLNQDSLYLYCNGKEFSNLEFGSNVLREAVLYILGTRKKGERYPIYITDIDMNQNQSVSDNTLQTVELLNYKKQIEERLNYTLNNI